MSIQSFHIRVSKDEFGEYRAHMKLGEMEFSTDRHGEITYMEYKFELICEDGTATVRVRDPLRDNKIVNKHSTTNNVWLECILWDKI